MFLALVRTHARQNGQQAIQINDVLVPKAYTLEHCASVGSAAKPCKNKVRSQCDLCIICFFLYKLSQWKVFLFLLVRSLFHVGVVLHLQAVSLRVAKYVIFVCKITIFICKFSFPRIITFVKRY